MSKKNSRSKQPPLSNHSFQLWHRSSIIVLLLLSLGGGILILGGWRSAPRGTAIGPEPLPQTTQTPRLAREYIYAGGRLIATEETASSGGTSPLSAPASLSALGTTMPTARINLSWAASAGGTVDHYEVERCQSFGPNCFSLAATVLPGGPTLNYSDTTAAAGSAYLYRVRAVDSSGNFSSYSVADLAVALSFTNDPLQTGDNIRAQHVTELRQAINAVRALANLSAATWTNAVQPGALIRAVDVQELRSNLDQARSALGLAAATYTNQPLAAGSTLIRRAHIDELRQAVK